MEHEVTEEVIQAARAHPGGFSERDNLQEPMR